MDAYFGFIYQWVDHSNGFKYIGSHYGRLDDGYISSNVILNRAQRKRPEQMERIILEYIFVDDKKYILEREQVYLDQIHDTELYNSKNRLNQTYKYYNMKKTAAGGNGSLGSNGKMKNTKKFYHEHTHEQRFLSPDDVVPDGWIQGVPAGKISSAGKSWYTNPITGKNIRSVECPGDGWILGRTYDRNSGKTGTRKLINTPDGVFESTVVCAEHYGIVRQTVSARCKSTDDNWNQWFFIEE